MDKLSEHAIRMLEITDKPYRTENVINANLQDRHDMAQAIYDLILQVQVLKTADRNCSEKPNNAFDKDTNVRSKDCETCKHNKLEWFSEVCDGCSKAHSNYEPKTEPQTCANGCRWLNQDGECTEPSGECHIEYRTEVDEPHHSGEVTEMVEPQTDIEIARAIVHKAIDDTPIAEDAYPDLRQRMHDAVDNYEPQTERGE